MNMAKKLLLPVGLISVIFVLIYVWSQHQVEFEGGYTIYIPVADEFEGESTPTRLAWIQDGLI